MNPGKCIVYLLLLFFAQPVFAQKKIVLEKIRSFAVNDPVITYWQKVETRKTIALQLSRTLVEHQLLPLADTTNVKIEFLPFEYIVPAIKPAFSDTDTSNLHLYIDFLETDPTYFFLRPAYLPLDSTLLQRTKTIFQLSALLLKQDRSIVFNETLNIAISSATTAGMGNLYGDGIRFTNLTVTPKVFTELLKAATNLLFNPKNNLDMVEIKLQPAFLADNYILPKTVNRPRNHVISNKGISAFYIGNEKEIIRLGEPVYEEIRIKGKKAEKYPDDLTKAIKGSENFSKSDFVFLHQDCRDVVRDRNYQLQLTTQIDPTNLPETESLLFTNFLNGNFHYLFQGKDTLAKFSILKNVTDKVNRVYTNILYNGYDSVSFYPVKPNGVLQGLPVIYDYQVEGVISNKPFSIKCSGSGEMVKEIFLDNTLVCIAQGKYSPEKFVLFDASLSPELLNRLFMIGFNRFFE